MKILYCIPVFLDYRLPFFKELVRLFEGQFYVMYSPMRYKLMHRMDLCERIKKELNNNARPFQHDYLFDTATMSFSKVDRERGQKIPFTLGLLQKIRHIKPDVLVTEGFFQWTPLVVLYGLLFRKPVFIGYERTCHTERHIGKLKTWHRKLTDKFVRGYLVNGSETKKYLLSIGIKEEKIHIGGMSADSDGLVADITAMTEDDIKTLKRKYQQNDGLLYLFSGQIVERKGVKYLLRAWIEHIKTHKDDRLVLVGYGDQLEELQNACRDFDSICFEGKVNYSDIYKYYAIADVFILPTIEDNWSLVIPEAMACGLPVATSIYNGCYPELVHMDVNGITFDTYKQETIIEALDYFHHHDLKKMGEASINLEKFYNTGNCANRVYSILNKKEQ